MKDREITSIILKFFSQITNTNTSIFFI